MSKRNISRTLMVSMLALCMCTVLITGGTYALFTDTVTVNHHLVAGNLDVGLYRTSYQECVLGANGLMTESTKDTTPVDLTKSSAPLFSVVGKAVPTSWYEATVEVSNLGSTAFDYWVEILWSPNEDPDDADEALAAQIQITVTSSKLSSPVTFMLSDCADHKLPLGYLLKNAGTDTFTVRADFLDVEENNIAMDTAIRFDVQVSANQKVSLE